MSPRSMETHSRAQVLDFVFHCTDEAVYVAQTLMANSHLLELYSCSNLLWNIRRIIHANHLSLSFLACNSGLITYSDLCAWGKD